MHKALELYSRNLVFAGVMGLAEPLEHFAETLEEALFLVFLRNLVEVNGNFFFDYFFRHFVAHFFVPPKDQVITA